MPIALAIVSLLVATSVLAAAGTHETRTLQRLVATPTPLGPATLLSDQAVWRVDVAEGTVVLVDASAGPNSPFYLRAHPLTSPEPTVGLPAFRQSFLLSPPGPWRVVVDPAAGAAVEITVTFRGSVSDVDGAPAAFTLTDLERGHGCVVPGVCLP